MADPDMGTWHYQYDGAGNLTQQTDANRTVTTLSYDALDRLTQRTYAVGTGVLATPTASFAYDGGTSSYGKGRRTSMSVGTGGATVSSVWQYDARGRKTSETDTAQGTSKTFGWTQYSSADQVMQMPVPQRRGHRDADRYLRSGGRPLSLCTNIGTPSCYVSGTPGAQYTALDQPVSLTLGNGVTEAWGYSTPMARLASHTVGPGASVFNRAYDYDNVGNVQHLNDLLGGQTQNFAYDERDRLSTSGRRAARRPAHSDESDGYDALGNLTGKGGLSFSFAGTTHAHAPTSVIPSGGTAQVFTYDTNGNTRTDASAGRSYQWNADNLPLTITTTPPPYTPPTQLPSLTAPSRGGATVPGNPALFPPSRSGAATPGTPNLTTPLRPVNTSPVTETYTYDADGRRATRSAGGITTLYLGGSYEVDTPTGVTRAQYSFGGRVVAQREVSGTNNTVVYLHGDHLGSVSVATASDGSVREKQEYGPWGTLRSGGVSTTTLNYTGQKRDGTGLLYYGARY